MRWRQNLRFRVVRPGEAVELGGDAAALAVTPAVEDGALVLRYRASGGEESSARESWHHNAHVVFLFDWEHDHFTRDLIAVAPDGTVLHRARELAAVGEDEQHVLTKTAPGEPRPVVSRPGELRIDLGGVPGPVIGLSAEVVRGGAPVRGARLVANRDPLLFCDLYLRTATVVRGVDFACPEWKLHHVRVDAPPGARRIATRFLDHAHETDDPARVPVFFDRRAKWSNDMALDAMLELTVDDWRASFPVSFDHGVIPRDRLGVEADRARPAPDDPAFVAKIERYYLAMLPPLRRVRDGGYALVAPGVRVDLLADDVLDRLCDIIRSTFDDPADALCAISVFVGSAAGFLHSAPRSPAASVVDVRDLFALGAGFCSHAANLAGLMAESIAPRYGQTWRSYSAGLQGHIVCAVAWGDAMHVIDPMAGKFFYALDNRRLATLDEMTRVPEITYRVDCFNRAHGHEFYVGRDITLQEFTRPSDRLLRVDEERE